MSTQKLIPTTKLERVRTIAAMRLNNIAAEIYTNKKGEAYIVCDKLFSQIPYANIKFQTLDECEKWIEDVPGTGAGRLSNILERLVP